jgi:hypothetical protein
MFDTDLVFAAACAAYRTNEFIYVKDSGYDAAPKTLNKVLLKNFVMDPDTLTPDDHAKGAAMRTHFKGFIFKTLSGQVLGDIDKKALTLASGDAVTDRDFGIIAYLPEAYARAVKRQSVDERLYQAQGGFIGKIGDKVVRTVEVLRGAFSIKWNCNFITAITETDEVVFFSYKNGIEAGTKISISGTVKSHRENQTQLNRVKIMVG